MIKTSVYSRSVAIWVSSTSFQKSDIGWPHQPPKEKLLKFNGIFMIMSKKIFFQNIKICPLIIEFKNLDDSEVLRSDFQDPRNLCSLIDLSSLGNLIGLTSLTSPISSKKFLIMMVWSSLAPKWPILVPFCGIDHQKSNFSLIFGTFSVGGCWGQAMLLFWKLVDETQMTAPREYTDAFFITKNLVLGGLRGLLKYLKVIWNTL